MRKIAVIIPNFNGFAYSERCFTALENQTFKDFEVAVIDDCSTDNSYEQLVEYAKYSSLNMKVIRLEKNMGPGFSRKKGIESTDSEWIAFCDIDDWYDDDFLEVQLRNAIDNKADLVICDNNFVYDDGRKVKGNVTEWINNEQFTKEAVLANAKMSLCRLFCKRKLFDGIILPSIYYGEDAPVTIQLIVNSTKHFIDRNSHYNYFIRRNSASSDPKMRAISDYQYAFDIIKSKIQNRYPEVCVYVGINMILYGRTLIMFKKEIDINDIKSVVVNFEMNFPNWSNNKYYKNNINYVKRIYLWAIKRKLFSLCAIYAKLHSFLVKI